MPGTVPDQSMLEALVATRYRALVGFATLLAGRADAEDLVQDSLVYCFSRSKAFPSIPQAESYVRRTIASRFVDSRRSALRRLRREQKHAAPERDRGHATAVDLSVDVSAAMQSLPPRVRACVALRYLSDLSTAETAATLHLSEGSVKRYVSDGVKALSKTLGVPVPDGELMPETSALHTTGGAP